MLSFTEPAVAIVEASDYIAAAGGIGWPAGDDAQEQAIMRGQRFVAGAYNARWTVVFENDAAPDVVRHAIIEAALVEARKPGSLAAPLPDKVLTGVDKITWAPISRPFGFNAQVPPVIEQILAGVVSASGHQAGWSWA